MKSVLPQLYGRPKLHKSDIPLCLIVSLLGIPIQSIERNLMILEAPSGSIQSLY